MSIPFIIHQIWMNPKEDGSYHPVPAKHQVGVDGWRQFAESNGGEHILWDETTMVDYIKEKDPSYLDMYQRIKSWIIRCDVFRFFTMYHMGGVYVDIDTRLLDPDKLKTQLQDNRVIIAGSNPNIGFAVSMLCQFTINNFFMGSVAGVEMFKCAYSNINLEESNVLKAAGPDYMSSIIMDHGRNVENLTVIYHEDIPIKHLSDKTWFSTQVNLYIDHYFLITFLVLIVFASLFAIGIWYYYVNIRKTTVYPAFDKYNLAQLSQYSRVSGYHDLPT